MKIIFLSFYSGIIERGVEVVVHELAKRLSKNHQVIVIQGGAKCSWQKFYPVISLKTSLKWLEVNPRGIERKLMIDYYSRKILYFTLASLSSIKDLKPDIIIPMNGGWQAFLIKFYSLFSGTKMVISGQAGLGGDEKWNILLKPDVYIALSKRNSLWARAFSKKVRVKTISNGVDLKEFQKNGQIIKFNLQKPIILCVAGPERYKRVKETIMAVRLLKRGSLLVIGGSEDIKIFGKKLLGSRFRELKFSHEKMPQVYRSSNLFTLVSEESEGFGISYLEAMACGLPVVGSDDELRREIVGGAGLFIKDPKNSKMYAGYIKKALKKKWGDLPRRQAEKFSWDKVAQRYQKVFESLIKK